MRVGLGVHDEEEMRDVRVDLGTAIGVAKAGQGEAMLMADREEGREQRVDAKE